MAKKSEGGGAKSAEKPITKADALRQSLEVNGWEAPLEKHEEYLREHFGVIMTRMQISQYKSAERRRLGKRRRRRRRSSEEVAAEPTERASFGRGDDIVKFVSTVRQWEEKLGSKKLLAVLDALYKQK